MNNSRLTRKTQMKKGGHRTWQWARTRAKLKVRFERAGITRCELRVCTGCTGSHYLSFAHAVKRRFITTQQELEEVALACLACHQTIEAFNHEDMKSIVRLAISERETQP